MEVKIEIESCESKIGNRNLKWTFEIGNWNGLEYKIEIKKKIIENQDLNQNQIENWNWK